MLPTSNYQFRILGGGHLWLPTHVPQGFHKDDRATWPPNAFLLPHDLEPDEKLAFLRQRLERKEFVEYCTIELLPDKWPEDIREEAAAVLALTRATTCFVDSESAPADAATPAFDPHGPPENFGPSAASALNRQHAAPKVALAPAAPPPLDPAQQAEDDRMDRTRAARKAARAAVQKERERLDALTRKLGPPAPQLPAPPLPPSTPKRLAERQTQLKERGPHATAPVIQPERLDDAETFQVGECFTSFTGREPNFLLWAEERTPQCENRTGSWLMHLLRRNPGNKERECSGRELRLREMKIVRWLREYYEAQVPKWLAAQAAMKRKLAEPLFATPGLELAEPDADFSTRWDPVGNAAQLFECTETQLNRICKNILGQNAKELWDMVKISTSNVAEMYEYEMRVLRHAGCEGGEEEEESGPEGVRRAIKRGRRKTGRTKATVAQRLGFLNNARLDRGFWHAKHRTLTEVDALLYARISESGTLSDQAEAERDEVAKGLAPSELNVRFDETTVLASYQDRIERTPCRQFQNLLGLDFATRARAEWYRRRKEKLQALLDDTPKLGQETDHKLSNRGDRNLELSVNGENKSASSGVPPLAADSDSSLSRAVCATGGLPASAVVSSRRDDVQPLETNSDPSLPRAVCATGGLPASAGSSPHAVPPRRSSTRSDFNPDQLEELRWRLEVEFPEAQRAWDEFTETLAQLVVDYIPLPDYAYDPAAAVAPARFAEAS